MVSDYLKVVTYFVLSFTNINFFHDSIFHESEIRTVLLEVSIDLGLLKKSLLKTNKIVLMYSNSLLRHFSSMVHAKLYIPSTLNNSNETHTFMCLGRAGHFGQH